MCNDGTAERVATSEIREQHVLRCIVYSYKLQKVFSKLQKAFVQIANVFVVKLKFQNVFVKKKSIWQLERSGNNMF